MDRFIDDLVSARALRHAFSLRLIDQLLERGGSDTLCQLVRTTQSNEAGLRVLLQLLAAAGIVELTTEPGSLTIHLAQSFRAALRYRDLLEAKLDFTLIAAADYLEQLPNLIADDTEFYSQSRIMELFDYAQCLEVSEHSTQLARRWMRFTTILTRYEGPICLQHYDCSLHREMLDVGGNSGEFARQVVSRYPHIEATVFDLPAVCEVGRQYQESLRSANSISFCAGNALSDRWPGRPDLISFKSMLHDWPDQQAEQFLQRAVDHLAPGGTLLIFERDEFDLSETPLRFSHLPMFMFFRSLRGPRKYENWLRERGLHVDVQPMMLEMPFFLLVARKV